MHFVVQCNAICNDFNLTYRRVVYLHSGFDIKPYGVNDLELNMLSVDS